MLLEPSPASVSIKAVATLELTAALSGRVQECNSLRVHLPVNRLPDGNNSTSPHRFQLPRIPLTLLLTMLPLGIMPRMSIISQWLETIHRYTLCQTRPAEETVFTSMEPAPFFQI